MSIFKAGFFLIESPNKEMNMKNYILVKGARENNLKNIDIKIPRNKFIVITGVSGSGKSSLAFNTIYAEGQRRYVESLSAYARQFLGLMEKPDVDYIEGLSPAISIEQKATSRNPRSTVGTVTEIYDYIRLLYARIGTQKCFKCNGNVERQTVQQIVDEVLTLKNDSKLQIFAPVVRERKGEFKDVISSMIQEGFVRARIDGKIVDLNQNIKLKKTKKHTIEILIDRLIIKPKIKDRLTESIELALKIGNGLVIIHSIDYKEFLYSEHFSCPKCRISFEELEPRGFSFNSPFGACQKCDGLGTEMLIDPDLVVPDQQKSLIHGCIEPIGEQPRGNWYSAYLKSLSKEYNFSFTTPWKHLSNDIQNILLFGTKKSKKIKVKFSSKKFQGEMTTNFEGVIPRLMRRYKQTNSGYVRTWIEKYMTIQPCNNCKGARLKKSSLSVFINNKNINELTNQSIESIHLFFKNIKLSKKNAQISEQIIKEIYARLEFLINVGLNYLTLTRPANTLSGGEAQRIRLATHIGSQLMGVLYILDEPSIGLHQRDNSKLIKTLEKLRDLGNTIIVVEHDENTMLAADWIVDIGPFAGTEGGEVIYNGDSKKILNHKTSLTGQYLSGKKCISTPNKRRGGNNKNVRLLNASGNNLKNIDLNIPLGKFVCVTGVSGSGKSTLINRTLYPILSKEYHSKNIKPLPYSDMDGILYLDKIIDINQSPIGKTPRSNPATYTGLFTLIRDLYASLPESNVRGYMPGRFSFNVKGGRCESCQGVGLIKIEMHFLADMYIKCDDCNGKRFNRETLEILYRGKTISDILNMSIDEAINFFNNHKLIMRKLETIQSVGLGYIKLGQQATTLSGGESQRVKLASELSKVNTGRTMYILDEPTTGLHFEDINMLLNVLHGLVDKGNSVIVIEHNLDVIKSADWIIDLGPEGGDKGGEIIGYGTPEMLIKNKKSHTGKFLKTILNNEN